ncbi:hypothetical protein ACLOJK_035863 [Asimina triloba]
MGVRRGEMSEGFRGGPYSRNSAGRKKRFKEKEKEIDSSSSGTEFGKWQSGEGRSVLVDREQGAGNREQGQDSKLVGREEEGIQGEGERDRFLVAGHGDRKTTKRGRQIGREEEEIQGEGE